MTDKDKPTSGTKPSNDTASKTQKTAANLNTQKKELKKNKKSSSLSSRALIILLIFLSGVIAAIYFMPALKDRLPIVASWIGENNDGNLDALNQRISQQQQQIDQLTQKSSDLEAQMQNMQGSGLDAPLSEIEERLAALEQSSGSIINEEIGSDIPATDTSQSARIDMLLSRMSQLEASFVPLSKSMIDGAQAEKDREALKDSSLALSEKVSILEKRLENVEQVAAKDNSALLLTLKINELKRKLNSGLPYNEELEIVTELVSKSALSANERVNNALQYLSGQAQTGILTADQLKQNFNNMIPDLISTKGMVEDAGWWQDTLNRIKNMITVRRTENAALLAESVDGLIAQIEEWLTSDDFRAIINLFETLPGAMQSLLQDWENAVEEWLQSQDALNDLETIATDSFLVNQPEPSNIPLETEL